LLALLAFGTAYFRRPTLEAEPLRLFVNPPEKATRFDWPMISPDGRTLAFVATVEGKTQLWIRPLNSTTAKPLVDLRLDVAFPSWSPDGQFLSYYEERKLKKIALAGGTPVTLCNMEAAQSRGTWNRDGIIVFGAGPNGLKRVSASGGAVTSVTTVDSARGEIIHGAPAFLPDGRHFLFFNTNSDPAKTGIYLGSLDGGETRQLLPLDNPVFALATNPAAKDKGYLVFARQSALLAQPYDFSRNQLTGEPVHLAEQVQISASNFAQFSVSTTGNLVLIEGTANQQLTWFDRAGKKLGTVGTLGIYSTPKLSPDEQRLAVGRLDPQTRTSDIRIFDLTRGTDSRFTFDPADDFSPLWSPDGNRLVWASNREGSHNLYQKIASGAGQDELLWKSAFRKRPLDWSADGRFIFYWETTPQTNNDVWVLPLESGARPYPWLNARFAEGPARFSPDGKWVAYGSNESGNYEIYLQAFVPGAAASASGGKWQISTNGGIAPSWQSDGRELYYVSADNKLMAIEVTPGAEVKFGIPQSLFSLGSARAVTLNTGYTLTRDGQRFLFVTNAEEASVPPFTVVLNWMAEVKK
jgi:Tol biopolymer transport system component